MTDVVEVGIAGPQGPQGAAGTNGTNPTGALINSNNLNDVSSKAAALANLGGVNVNGPAQDGYVVWNADRWTAIRYAPSVTASPSGYLNSTRVVVPSGGVTISGFLDFMEYGGGGGEAGVYAGFYSPAGALIAQTTDMSGINTWRTISLGVTTLAAGNYWFVGMQATAGTAYNGPEAIGGALSSNSTASPTETGSTFSSFRAGHYLGSYTTLPANLPTTGWQAWYLYMPALIR